MARPHGGREALGGRDLLGRHGALGVGGQPRGLGARAPGAGAGAGHLRGAQGHGAGAAGGRHGGRPAALLRHGDQGRAALPWGPGAHLRAGGGEADRPKGEPCGGVPA